MQTSNHCKLLSSKAMVVSVAAKGGTKSRQVWSGEASASKPSMKCRNSKGDVKTGGSIFSRDQLGGGPEACPSGIRHVGGAKPDQALVWNVRTCRPDVRGDAQAARRISAIDYARAHRPIGRMPAVLPLRFPRVLLFSVGGGRRARRWTRCQARYRRLRSQRRRQ